MPSSCGFWCFGLLRSAVLRRESPQHDVTRLADFLAADHAAELVFADFGLAGGGGRGVVIDGEADALGEDEFEGGFAFAAHVDVFAVGPEFFGHQADEAGETFGGGDGPVGIRIEAAAAGDDAEHLADALVVTGAGFDIGTLAAHGREVILFGFHERARGVVERLLRVEHGLGGIPHWRNAGFEGGELGGTAAVKPGSAEAPPGKAG